MLQKFLLFSLFFLAGKFLSLLIVTKKKVLLDFLIISASEIGGGRAFSINRYFTLCKEIKMCFDPPFDPIMKKSFPRSRTFFSFYRFFSGTNPEMKKLINYFFLFTNLSSNSKNFLINKLSANYFIVIFFLAFPLLLISCV